MRDFLKSVAVISAGGIVSKIIGVFYRIPLSNLLGGYGMGLYQMAYPFFCLLLTFSSVGIPSALSRIVAEEEAKGRNAQSTLKTALRLFSVLGLTGTALMLLFADRMSALQSAPLALSYRLLAPSVFLVALIAVLRGYFQGKNDMTPTAVSEMIEQLTKAAAGLYFAAKFASDPPKAVAYTLFAVTLSEAAALALLLLRLRGRPVRAELAPRRTESGRLLAAVLPVMAATSLLPLSQTVDSVMIVRLMSGYTDNAVALYGLFTGGALALVNLPATACYGLAAASVPAVSGYFAKGETEKGRKSILRAVLFTLGLSVPCALGLFFLAKPIVSLLYPSLAASESATLISLLKTCSLSAVTLAGTDTLAACLTGMGRAKQAAKSMGIAVLIKFALQWLLVRNPALSVTGAAISANACYLVAFFLDLFYTVRKDKCRKRSKRNDYGRRSWNSRRRAVVEGACRLEEGAEGVGAQCVSRQRDSERRGDFLSNAR